MTTLLLPLIRLTKPDANSGVNSVTEPSEHVTREIPESLVAKDHSGRNINLDNSIGSYEAPDAYPIVKNDSVFRRELGKIMPARIKS